MASTLIGAENYPPTTDIIEEGDERNIIDDEVKQEQEQEDQQQQQSSTYAVPTRSTLRFVDDLNNNQEEQEQNPLHHQDDDDKNLPCLWWLRGIPTILFISFMIGITIGTTSAIIPDLQGTTFGNNSFIIVGGFGGGKGLLALAYTPIVGSLSDEKSRFMVLMTTMVLSLIPWAIMTIFNNFWTYTVANMIFGLYNVSFTILVVIITANVPQRNKSRTLALSANVAVFLLGIAGSSFLGPVFSGRTAFAISLVAQFLCTLAAFFFLRKSTHSPNKYFHLAEIGSSISNGSGIIANNNNNSSNKKNNNNHEQEEEHEDDVVEEDNNNNHNDNNVNEKTSLLVVSTTTTKNDADDQKKSKAYGLGFHIARSWKLFVANRNIKILFLVSFFNYLTSDMLDQMLFLYLQEALNFSSNDITYTIAIMSVSSALFVVFIAVTKNHINDTWVLRLALISSFVMVCLYGFVTNKLFVIFLPAVNLVGMAVLPSCSSLCVDSVSPAEIGVGQGLVQASRTLGNIICPFMYGYLFQISLDSNFPGWPFFVAAGCVGISIFLTIFLKFEKKD